MKANLLKYCIRNIPVVFAITCFLLFSSVRQDNEKDKTAVAASECCSGYSITKGQLKKFMLDSLDQNQFEGGVYRKKDLLDILRSLPDDDSLVYLLNVLTNLEQCKKTSLTITSKNSAFIYSVTRTKRGNCNLQHCPDLACCSQRVYASKLSRCCINYIVYKEANEQPEGISLSSSQ